jgi:transposase-like protein
MSMTRNKYSPEVREPAVRLVLDNQGQHGGRRSAILLISSKIGCAPQMLNDGVKKDEVDRGDRTLITIEMAEMMKMLGGAIRLRKRILAGHVPLPLNASAGCSNGPANRRIHP